MAGDYKKLLNKKKKKVFADPKTMGINIDKNEYYEIILSNSAHPEDIKKNWLISFFYVNWFWAVGHAQGRKTFDN